MRRLTINRRSTESGHDNSKHPCATAGYDYQIARPTMLNEKRTNMPNLADQNYLSLNGRNSMTSGIEIAKFANNLPTCSPRIVM